MPNDHGLHCTVKRHSEYANRTQHQVNNCHVSLPYRIFITVIPTLGPCLQCYTQHQHTSSHFFYLYLRKEDCRNFYSCGSSSTWQTHHSRKGAKKFPGNKQIFSVGNLLGCIIYHAAHFSSNTRGMNCRKGYFCSEHCVISVSYK